METKKSKLLRMLNNVMFAAASLTDKILSHSIEIEDEDIFDVERACKLLINNLETLEELPF